MHLTDHGHPLDSPRLEPRYRCCRRCLRSGAGAVLTRRVLPAWRSAHQFVLLAPMRAAILATLGALVASQEYQCSSQPPPPPPPSPPDDCPESTPPPPAPPLKGCEGLEPRTFTPELCTLESPCEVDYGNYDKRYGCPFKIENLAPEEASMVVIKVPLLMWPAKICIGHSTASAAQRRHSRLRPCGRGGRQTAGD